MLTLCFQINAGKAESIFIPIVASIVGTMDIIVKAQSTLAADRVKRQLIVEVNIILLFCHLSNKAQHVISNNVTF